MLTRDTVVLASSRQLGWDGAAAELGRSRAWEPVEVAVAGHYLAINVDSKPLPMEDRNGGECRRVAIPPDSFQIIPANMPFTTRILKPAHYGAVEISLPKVRHLLGCDLQVQPALGVVDEPLAEVVRALLAEVARGGSSGPLYADGLLIAVVSRLAYALGCSPARSTPVGALSTERLRRVTEAIEDRIDQRLTVGELAAVTGLSPAHFAREFKRATHETPHAFVLRRRLERARQLLIDGCSIADAAHRCGFSDQAHLSRAFKEKFGVTPGVFARASRR
jgi:AraC family transcriptional regulator